MNPVSIIWAVSGAVVEGHAAARKIKERKQAGP